MLLGSSSDAIDMAVDRTGVVDLSVDVGVPAAPQLVAFADAAHWLEGSLDDARAALAAVVGEAGVVEAAGTVAIFRSLNIAADASGIAVDDAWSGPAQQVIDELGIDSWTTAANSPNLR